MVETAREELRRHQLESNPADESAFSAGERVARTTLFSIEIDAAFHKARCARCSENAGGVLAEAA